MSWLLAPLVLVSLTVVALFQVDTPHFYRLEKQHAYGVWLRLDINSSCVCLTACIIRPECRAYSYNIVPFTNYHSTIRCLLYKRLGGLITREVRDIFYRRFTCSSDVDCQETSDDAVCNEGYCKILPK